METANFNLNKAARVKNDEFYTKIEDIEKELENYKDFFVNKIIYCNCDNPEKSNFYKYFLKNFSKLQIKKLISTFYIEDQFSYKTEVVMINNEFFITKYSLKGNGDFRNQECIDILNEADIIVTNPPFSLFREYVKQLIVYEKQFIIIGSENSVTYKDIFSLIKNNKLWIGYTRPKKFIQLDNTIKKFGNICWYTNLDTQKRHEYIYLNEKYIDLYPEYDNYNAIEISNLKSIPFDYNGLMGVPITFIDKYNPNQFEIIGSDFEIKYDLSLNIIKKEWNGKIDRGYINGKRKYARIFIKNILK